MKPNIDDNNASPKKKKESKKPRIYRNVAVKVETV